jgi:hypothetical protein
LASTCPKLNEDKELQAQGAFGSSFQTLFFPTARCIFGTPTMPTLGSMGAVGVLIYKDFYEMWHCGLAQRW